MTNDTPNFTYTQLWKYSGKQIELDPYCTQMSERVYTEVGKCSWFLTGLE